MDKQEEKVISRKDALIKRAETWEAINKDNEITLSEFKGKNEVWKLQGEDVKREEGVRVLYESDLWISKGVASLMRFLANWVSDIETQTDMNNKILTRLLGLGDHATQQEIEEAITDIGAIMGDARRRRRGGT